VRRLGSCEATSNILVNVTPHSLSVRLTDLDAVSHKKKKKKISSNF